MAPVKVALLACGSFNPPTYMHFRMFEIARDHLQALGTQVVGGVMSPVHDAYAKKDLVSAQHRCAMLRLALRSSGWVKLSEWEVQQAGWTRTRVSLQYHQDTMDAHARGGGGGDAPAWLPDDVLNENRTPDETDNANLNNNYCRSAVGGGGGGGRVAVKLLCGADLLESFATPGLWSDEDLETIVGEHGLVVVSRAGTDPARFIYESDMLYRYRHNVTLVTNWVTNDVSSTALRKLLRRGQSIKYLTDDAVASYARAHLLYTIPTTDTEYCLTRLDAAPQDVAMLTPEPSTETNYKNILISIRDKPSIVDETITVTKRARKTNFILPYSRTDSIGPVFETSPKKAYLDALPANFKPGKAVKIVSNAKSHTIVKNDEEVSLGDRSDVDSVDSCTSAERDDRYKRRVSAGNVESNDRSVVGSTEKKVASSRSLGGTMKKNKKEIFSMGSIKKSLSEVTRLSAKVKNLGVKEKELEPVKYKTRSCNDIVKLVLTKHGIHVISDTEAIV